MTSFYLSWYRAWLVQHRFINKRIRVCILADLLWGFKLVVRPVDVLELVSSTGVVEVFVRVLRETQALPGHPTHGSNSDIDVVHDAEFVTPAATAGVCDVGEDLKHKLAILKRMYTL